MPEIYTSITAWGENNPQALFAIALIMFAIGMILGAGEKRKIVVFQNYDDLFLTFLVPSLFGGSLLCLAIDGDGSLFTMLGLMALVISFGLFFYVAFQTLKANEWSFWKFAIAMLVKFPLAFLWILHIFALLRPPGDTAGQRAKNRANALMIFIPLTVVVGALVARKTGLFSPVEVLRGKRIGAIRRRL